MSLVPGQRTDIRLSASVRKISSEYARRYSMSDRGCRLPHELPSERSIFKTYEQSQCRYECALKATKEEYRSCTPWDIPYPFVEDRSQLCLGRLAAEFKGRLNFQAKNLSCEECEMPACEHETYEHEVRSTLKQA